MEIESTQLQYFEPKALKFRKTKIWVIFINWVFAPIYEFIWEYIFNFHGKILYYRSPLRKKSHNLFTTKGLKLVKNDPKFKEIATLIRNNLSSSILDIERQTLLKNSDEEAYATTLESLLDEHVKTEIVKFALSDNILSHVYSHFKVVPKLTGCLLLYNIPREGSLEEGSKSWHRDSDTYKALNVFICISDVDEDSGAYHAVDGSTIPHQSAIPKKYSLLENIWKRFRISDEELYQCIQKNKVTQLIGESGTGIFVDPGLCYHKGGFCKKHERLMLQISFTTDDRVGSFESLLTKYNLNTDVADTKEKMFIVSSSSRTWKILRKLHFTKFIYLLHANIFKYFL